MNPHISPSLRFYRTIFLSDFHIGAKAFDARALLSFLKSHDCETMYLVGDIIDGWKLSKRWHWSDSVSEILDELARKVDNGMKLVYLPGNHDEEVRMLPLFRRLRFARRLNITIRNRMVHRCADGRKFLIMHGDQFDRALFAGPVSRLSDRLYDLFLDLIGGHHHMTIVVNGQEKRFSLAKYLSKQGQKALHFLNNFETAIVREARSEGVHGIICGHTHIPALKKIADITYGNCGSWLRTGHTALAEDESGALKLIDWPAHQPHHYAQTNFAFMEQNTEQINLIPDSRRYRAVTLKLIESIRRVWPVQAQMETTPKKIKERIYALNQIALHEIMLKAVQGDIRVRYQESWNRFHIVPETSFIFKFAAKT